MANDARANLAAQQEALVRALAGLASCPTGFDAEQVHTASVALAEKRSRSVAKSLPDFARVLGDRFDSLFENYAKAQPAPHPAGPKADGYLFAEYLRSQRQLDFEGLSLWLALRLSYRCTETGLQPRRGLAVAWERLPGTNRLLIGVRAGNRVWRFPSLL